MTTTAAPPTGVQLKRIVSPLAVELAPVRGNAVSPGLIDTDWWAFLSPEQRAAQFERADIPDTVDYASDIKEFLRSACAAASFW